MYTLKELYLIEKLKRVLNNYDLNIGWELFNKSDKKVCLLKIKDYYEVFVYSNGEKLINERYYELPEAINYFVDLITPTYELKNEILEKFNDLIDLSLRLGIPRKLIKKA